MRILFLNPSGQWGGAEALLLDVMIGLREAEPRTDLSLIVASEGLLASRASRLGFRTSILPFPRSLARLGDAASSSIGARDARRGRAFLPKLAAAIPGVAVYVVRLRRAIREMSPDIVQTNGFKMHVLGVWARPARVPVIWHVHDYVGGRPVMARLMRLCAPRCAATVANSEAVAQDLRSVGGPSAIHVVHNGIDLEHFSPRGSALDLDRLAGMPGAKTGTVRVGLIATFARWKGHATFLKALSLLGSDPPVRGYVIGAPLYETDGSQYSWAELRGLAAELRIAEQVGFTGFVEDPAAAMRALDIVVHASTQPEPFGLVIAEAMACGRAVVASHAGGAREIVEADVTALGHPPGDAEALAERISRLVRDVQLRARLGKEARAWAEYRLNRARLTSQMVPIYRAVLSPTN
jgi:glycosyltransferase involved in cell wall biosynthesis